MSNINTKAYTELYEILKNIPEEDIKKIPNKILEMIEKKRDKNYEFHLKEKTEFENQCLLRETKVLLAILYRDYWATEEEKEKIIQKWKLDIEKDEEEKRKLYNTDELFKEKQIVIEQKNFKDNNENMLIEIKNEKFYQKILKFFKKLFHKFPNYPN